MSELNVLRMKLLNILKLISGKGVSALWAETKGSQANISKMKNIQSIGQNTEKKRKENAVQVH